MRQPRPLTRSRSYIDYLDQRARAEARASFRLGREKFEKKLKLEEGIPLSVDRLLTIALRELNATQEEFRRVASRMNGGDPLEIWRKDEGAPSGAGPADSRRPRQQVQELAQFIERNDIVSMPAGEPVVVAPTPDFYRWSFASMWTAGPFEAKPTRAYYYLTDVDPSWPIERQDEHLRDFNYPTLWSISIHEVYPGHFLHFQHLRQLESKLRKSTMFASASLVEGWAHYCEQMMLEAGFEKGQPRDPARPARRDAHPARPLHRRDPAARRGSVGRGRDADVPRRGVHGGGERPPGGGARDVRPDLPGLYRRQADAA